MLSRLEVSVVVPCLNEAAAVGAVVEQAWLGIHRSGRMGEVIVADNGSGDASAEIAATHGARVVRGVVVADGFDLSNLSVRAAR